MKASLVMEEVEEVIGVIGVDRARMTIYTKYNTPGESCMAQGGEPVSMRR